MFLLVLLGTMFGTMKVSAQEAYAYIATSDRTTLYFYYDNNRSSRNSTGTTYNLNTGTTNPGWISDSSHPYQNINTVTFDRSFSNYLPTSTYCWFYQMTYLTTINGFYNLYTRNVTDMSYMFSGCSNLSSLDFRNKSGSDTNMTDNYIFNTEKVTSMKGMFAYCRKLTTLDLSGWNTSSVTNMEQMFIECNNLQTITLGRGYSNGSSTESNGWNTSNLTKMDLMFGNCTNLTTISVGYDWTTAKVSTSQKPFTGCANLVGGEGSSFAAYGDNYNNPDYARIDGSTSSSGNTVIGFLTAAAQPYVFVNSGKTQLTFYCDELFSARTEGKAYILNSGSNDPGWRLSVNDNTYTRAVFDSSFANARPKSTYKWFCNMCNLESIEGFEYLNTNWVTNMDYMFTMCKAVNTLDFSHFATYEAKSMDYMFSQCTSLITLDLSSFNTSKVTKMSHMFLACTNLVNIYVGTYFKVDQVTVSNQMFYNCPKLVGGRGTKFSSSHIDKEYAHVDGGEENPGYFSYKPYAVYTSSNHTLTFYADGLSNSKAGKTYSLNKGAEEPKWYTDGNSAYVETVVFHSSFAGIRPTTTYAWFVAMANLTTITGIENLNTSEVTNMDNMFSLCRQLANVDLSHFNTAKVTTMKSMFNECNALTTLNLADWNTANVTDMRQLFTHCTSLVSLDLSGWNTSKVTNMYYMFYEDTNLKTIYAGNKWSTSSLGDDFAMFANCTSLVGGKGTTYSSSHTNKDYARIDGGNSSPGYFSTAPYAVYYNGTLTFYDDGNRSGKTGTKYSLNAPNKAPGWLENKESVTKVVFHSSFADARPVSATSWFYGMENLTTITGIENLNTSEMTSMYCMFYKCSQLTSLDLSGFNTAKVTNMRAMFRFCSQLKSIYISSDWSTANVTNSENMFNDCTNLMGGGGTTYDASHITLDYAHADQGATNPGYLSYKPYAVRFTNSGNLYFYADGKPGNKSGTVYNLNTGDEDVSWASISSAITGIAFDASFANARPTSTKNWFNNMTNLTSITWIERLHTDEVTSVEAMFKNCSALTTANLTSFNTAKVTTMDEMFAGCTNLTTINISSRWTTDNVTSSANMFNGCSALVGGNGTTYDASHIDKEYARLDIEGTPGYFTSEPPYLILSSDEKTLTLYNDGLSGEKEGTMYNFTTDYQTTVPWRNKASGITKVVFDESFATARMEWVNGWFGNMTNLTTIEGMEYFNFSSTRRFNYLFSNCTSLEEIDLSHFTPGYGCAMGEMFYGCINLKTILVASDWTLSSVSNGDNMFYGCTSLVGGKGTQFDSNHPGRDYARIDGGTSNPGYLTVGTREEYGVWDGATSTLTHYYDYKKELRRAEGKEIIDGQGYDEISWDNGYIRLNEIEKVIYDQSCTYEDGVYPVWFCGGMENLTSIEGLEYLNTSNETDFSNMFYQCAKIETLDLSNFDTRNATNMSNMFGGCVALQNITLGENWSTENVTNMSGMFSHCSYNVIHTVISHENFSTANVTNMSYMFSTITSFSNLSLTKFNTAKVTNMNNMFEGSWSLTSIFVGTDWSTESVTTSTKMFTGCTNLVGGAGTAYNASHVTADYAHIDGGVGNPGYFRMQAFTPYVIYDETTTTLSFYADGKGYEKDGTMYDLPESGDAPGWSTDGTRSRVTKVVIDKSFITARPTSTWLWFGEMGQLTEIEGLENLMTSEVTNMDAMFGGCVGLTVLDLSTFDTQNVTNMGGMFWGCNSLETIYVGSTWNTDKVTNGEGMFYNCYNLVGCAGTQWDETLHGGPDANVIGYAHVDGGEGNPGLLSGKTEAYVVKSSDNKTLSFYYDGQRFIREGTTYDLNMGSNAPGWIGTNGNSTITKAVFDSSFADLRPTTTYRWFYGLFAMTEIQNIEYLNTSEVKIMSGMFGACRSLSDIDVSHFDTKKVTDMGSMFYQCIAMTNLDLSNFDTKNVTNMNWMFNASNKLETLDLSSFNTSKVVNMVRMFYNCKKLKTIYVGEDWNAQRVSQTGEMFTNCDSIVGGNGTTYDATHVDKTYAIIDGGEMDPGYLTYSGTYAVYDATTTTLTFYCDSKKNEKTGTVYSLNKSTDVPAPAPAWFSDGTCYSVTKVVFDTSFANARPTTTKDWFVAMYELTTIEGMQYLNTSEVTDMQSMFSLCRKLEKIDVSGFDTQKVTDMGSMFNECNALKTLDLRSFDTQKVVVFNYMFYHCTSLTTIYAESDWSDGFEGDDTFMFDGCESLVGGGGTEWNSSNPINVSFAHLDGGEMDPGYFSAFDLEAYAVYNSYNTTLTFYFDNNKLSHTADTETVCELNADGANPGWYGLDPNHASPVTIVVFDESFADARPTTTFRWFYKMAYLEEIVGIEYLNTSEVTDMFEMFEQCYSLQTLDVSHFNTSKVTDMGRMFTDCQLLTTIDVSHFNTEQVQTMWCMFANCASLTSIDVSHFNTENVQSMAAMFSNCDLLTSIDVSRFNTDKVGAYGFASMFFECKSLKNIDLSNFNTSHAVFFDGMFCECESLATLDLSSFDTRNSESMYLMFKGCTSLKRLDLTNFVTDKVNDMRSMFEGCNQLKAIYVGDGWSTESATEESEYTGSVDMFKDCLKLVGGAGTVYDADHTNNEYAHVDGGSSNPGYFTAGPAPAYLVGDVNHDCDVNVADVTALVNLLNAGNVEYFEAADVDSNGRVDEQDVKALVNFIIGSAPAAIVLNYQVKAKLNNDYVPIKIDLDQRICNTFGLTVDQISDKITYEFRTVVEDGSIMLYEYNNDGTFCSNNYNIGYPNPGYWMDKAGYVRNWDDGDTALAICFNKDSKQFFIYQKPNSIESGDTMKIIFALRYNNGGEMITVGLNFNLTFSDDIDADIVTLM